MTTLQDKRHEQTVSTIARLTGQRDGLLASLVRYETRLKQLRKLEARQQKALARPAQVVVTPAAPPPAPLKVEPAAAPAGDAIPAFLDRRSAGQKKDDEARARIEAANTERKKAKASGRIARMKAKASGDTRRMPLTGRAALAHINAG